MFETNDFKDQLREAVSMEAAYGGIKEYQTEIIDYLQRLASENENILMERELRKAASERRGIRHALVSARELTKEASKYAVADRRTLLRTSDVQEAYRAKFCQFWPFCKQMEQER